MDHKKYIAGGISGLIEILVTHPIDYIKTIKQQYSQNNKQLNIINFIKNNNNLYKGIKPRICGVIPLRCIFWGVQDTTNTLIKDKKFSKLTNGLIIGINTGFFHTFIDNPIEILKIQNMNNKQISIINIIKNNYGYFPTLYRNIGFSICMGTIVLQNKTNDNCYNFILSASAGLIGSIITQPFDFIKTKLQREKNNINTFKLLKYYLKTNPYSLYTGLSNRCILNVIAMSIGFVVYDNIYNLMIN